MKVTEVEAFDGRRLSVHAPASHVASHDHENKKKEK